MMSTQPTPRKEEQNPNSTCWIYVKPSSGARFATHHAQAAFERKVHLESIMKNNVAPATLSKEVRTDELSLLEGVKKTCSAAPVVPSKEFLADMSLSLNVLQSEWVMIGEMEEWDMMPEIAKPAKTEEGEKVTETETKIFNLVVGWVSGQK